MIWDTLKFFKEEEFRCSCCGRGKEEMDANFLRLLDLVRAIYSNPLVVTSGYRCEEHDIKIGGKGNHTTGKAVDLLVPDSADRLKMAHAICKVGLHRVLIYKHKPHIHIDHCLDKTGGLFAICD